MQPSAERLALFAVTAPGLEAIAAAELAELGIAGQAEAGGVAWQGTIEQLQQANLHLRTASRVLLRIGEFRARTFFELERHARRLPWDRYLPPQRAVQLGVTCRKSRLYHQGAVAQRFHEAIQHVVGSVAAVSAQRDDAEEEGEEQRFVIRFLHDRCTVSADSSGALLHRRGYRLAVAKAPLRETLAAAMLLASGWRGQAPLLDPMCGSGTLPIEAALLARRIAPGLAGTPGAEPRSFAFQQWPEHDPGVWERVVARAREAILPRAEVAIHGSDRDEGAIEAARANASRAGVDADIRLAVAPLSAADVPPSTGTGWMVVNPPYGARVGESRPLRDLYAAIGKLARRRMPGWTVAMLSADRRLEAQVGIGFSEAMRTNNGGIPVRLVVGQASEPSLS
jgi:putative N6-adenine-specific DNA methylase